MRNDTVASIGSLFSSAGVDSGSFEFAEGEGIPTDLVAFHDNPGGIPDNYVFSPEGTFDAAMAAGAVPGAIVLEGSLKEALQNPRLRAIGLHLIGTQALGRLEASLPPGNTRGTVRLARSAVHFGASYNALVAAVGSGAAALTTAETGVGAVAFGTLGVAFSALFLFEAHLSAVALEGAISDFGAER